MGQPGLFFVYFRPFHNTMKVLVYNSILHWKSFDVVLGFEPRATGWKDGRHELSHWAMMGPNKCYSLRYGWSMRPDHILIICCI